jgi:hypothetical protein
MQGAKFRGRGTRNGTSREVVCLDSGHEWWPKREDGLPRTDGANPEKTEPNPEMMQSVGEHQEVPKK